MWQERKSGYFKIGLQSNTLFYISSEKRFTQYSTAVLYAVFKNSSFKWTQLCKT